MKYETLEELREAAYAMLKPTRIAHVMGCEEEAARLALRWGESEEDARRAAIVHDCTKKEPISVQLALCEKYGIEPDALEKESTALLHSKTGAAVAKYEFFLPDRVSEAVKWHTTGKADMTLLEKIVYLADMIEPTREYPGVEDVRALAYEDLDAALMLAFERTLAHTRERGIEPHENTRKALKFLLEEKKDKDK